MRGATFMAAFPVEKRFLTRGTRLMLHERLMSSSVQLSGPLTTLPAVLKAKPSAAKGKYVKSATLCATMSPGIQLDVTELTAKEAAQA